MFWQVYIRTCLNDDLNVSLHSPSKRNSLYLLFSFRLFLRFEERDVYAVQQNRTPNAAESTQPLQNSHVWAQEELIILQPTLSAAPRPWKWDRLYFFFFLPPHWNALQELLSLSSCNFVLVLITCFGIFQTQASIFFKNIWIQIIINNESISL